MVYAIDNMHALVCRKRTRNNERFIKFTGLQVDSNKLFEYSIVTQHIFDRFFANNSGIDNVNMIVNILRRATVSGFTHGYIFVSVNVS